MCQTILEKCNMLNLRKVILEINISMKRNRYHGVHNVILKESIKSLVAQKITCSFY